MLCCLQFTGSFPPHSKCCSGCCARFDITWDCSALSCVCVADFSVSRCLNALKVVCTRFPRRLRLEPCDRRTALHHPAHNVCYPPPQFRLRASTAACAAIVSPQLYMGFLCSCSGNVANKALCCGVQVRPHMGTQRAGPLRGPPPESARHPQLCNCAHSECRL